LTYIPLGTLKKHENAYLVRVINNLIKKEENERIKLGDLKERFEKLMGYPLRNCFDFPDDIEEFLKRKKKTYLVTEDIISFAPKVDDDNMEIVNNQKAVIILDDDVETQI
jgi:hypothetical protein